MAEYNKDIFDETRVQNSEQEGQQEQEEEEQQEEYGGGRRLKRLGSDIIEIYDHGKDAFSEATGLATETIGSTTSRIIETAEGATSTMAEKLKPAVSETRQVVDHAAKTGKEVAKHPIYYVQKATSFFWEHFPPLSWFTYGVIALNAIPLTILVTFLFITTSIVAFITGIGIFLAEGFFIGVGSFFLVPVMVVMVFASFVTAFFTVFGWSLYKSFRYILRAFDLIGDDNTISFDTQHILSKTSEILKDDRKESGSGGNGGDHRDFFEEKKTNRNTSRW